MKTNEFLNLLENNPNKELVFEYEVGKLIGANYHLTEVKNVTFNTVDCGGNTNHWKETQIQLWESPSEIGKTDYLTTNKALSILNRVNSIKPLLLSTEIKVEFGNDHFHTSVLKIANFSKNAERLIIQLFEEKTLCKAPDTRVVEDVSETTSSCCGTEKTSTCCS